MNNNTNNKPLISYPQLIQELERLCNTGSSGVMLIMSSSKHSIRFVLDKGRIIACGFTSIQGIEALSKISNIHSGSFSFVSGDFSSTVNSQEFPLPTNKDIFQILNHDNNRGADNSNNAPVKAAEQTASKTIDAAQILMEIKTELSGYVGPLAEFICDDHLDDVGMPTDSSSVIEMINSVSLEIDNQKDREQFKEKLYTAIA